MNRPFPSRHARFLGQCTGRLGLLCFCYLIAPDLSLLCLRFRKRSLVRIGNRRCGSFRYRYSRRDHLRAGASAWDTVYIRRILDGTSMGPFASA